MKTLTYQLRDLKKAMICIGFEDENNRTQVRIDCGEVFGEYPNAAVSMKVQAPKGGIYPATVTREGNMILWTVRDCDVANKGSGEFQLTFTDGTTVIKTCVGRFHVDRSLKGSGTAPSGVQDWLENAEKVLEQVESAEIHQPMIGLDGYWYTWDQENEEYVKTNTKAQGSGADLIDDTTPSENKVFSSSKVNTELNTVKSDLQAMAVTPERFGAKGDGVTDDSQAVQDAVDAGYNIKFDDNKTYYLASTVTINHDVHLIGGKNTEIKTKTPDGGIVNTAIEVSGTLKKTTTLTSDYEENGNTENAGDRFKLSDMTGINIGDIMVIEATDQFYSYNRDYYYLGATLLVSDVTEEYIFTCDAMPFDIENTENVTVKIYSAPVVTIESLKFVSDFDSAGEYVYAVQLMHCNNAVIKNCTIDESDNGIRIFESVNTLVDGVTVTRMPLSGTGRALDHYGIGIYSSSNTTVRRMLGNAANSCIDMSGTYPNINTFIKECNLVALSRHNGIGMHENAYNTVVEDCVIAGFLAYGTVKVNRCRFIKSYRQNQNMAINFRGTHNPKHGRLIVTDCVIENDDAQISIPTPYTQDNPQAYHHVIGEVVIRDCIGGRMEYVATTSEYILSNTIQTMVIENWKNCYEFWHTNTAFIANLIVKNCNFNHAIWMNDHANHLSTGGIGVLRVLNDCGQQDKMYVDLKKYGGRYYLPENTNINFTQNSATDRFGVCGENLVSNVATDFAMGSIGGSVGSALTRSVDANFSSALSVNTNDEIVVTQPNNLTKVSLYPFYMLFVPKGKKIKLSCTIKNTGNTDGSSFRPTLAIVSCKTGLITYRNNNGTVKATPTGALATHERDMPEDSLVLFFMYCNDPVQNAETTFSDFVVKVFNLGEDNTLTFEKFKGSSRTGTGSLMSVEGLNNILSSVNDFDASFAVDFMENPLQ